MTFMRGLRRPVAIAPLLMGLLLAPLPTAAQSSSGGGAIQGVVRDSSGAVIHSAKVSVTHLETGVTTATASNETGRFTTPALPIGGYRVRVESAGMSAWAGELVLRVGQIAEVAPVLSPGNVNETIVVHDAVPLVATADATEASTLDSRRIAELPTDGRDMMMLLQDTTPGLEYGLDDYMPDSLRTAGMPIHATNYTQDGAVSNHREFGGGGNLQGLESIGELRVETSTSSARYSAPASVIISTKSGANRLHGTLYETARNNAFGVARAREDVNPDGSPYQLPKLIRNEFGGSIGGPVLLPSFGWNGKRLYDGRNRTFFFYSQEQRETRQAVTMEWKTPTAAMREGDFSAAVDGQGRRITLYDPLTTRRTTGAAGQTVAVRDPFAGNRISPSRISPLARALYAITPLPTDITNPLVTANLRKAVATATYSNMSYNPATVRFDHRFGDRDNAFVKINGGTQLYDGLGWNGNTGAPTLGNEANYTYAVTKSVAAAVSWTHLFSSSFFVETLASRMWLRSSLGTGPEDRNWARELGLPNPFGGIGWPSITGITFMNYIEGDARRYIRSNVLSLQQNYSWLRGNHSFQFGFNLQNDLENLKPDAGVISGSTVFSVLPTALQNPAVSAAASPTALPQTGLGAASLFLGYADSYAARQHRPLMRTSQNQYALYIQDSWRVTPRLTLIPGLRWDMNPALTERNDLLTGFDVASHAIVLPRPLDHYYRIGASNPRTVALFEGVGVKFATATDVGRDSSILPSNWRDVGPRMGFAWRLSGGRRQLVLRGGYGLYFTGRALRTLLNGTSAIPFQTDYSYNPNNASQSPDGIANYTLRSAPTVVAGASSANVVDVSNPQAIGRGVGGLANRASAHPAGARMEPLARTGVERQHGGANPLQRAARPELRSVPEHQSAAHRLRLVHHHRAASAHRRLRRSRTPAIRPNSLYERQHPAGLRLFQLLHTYRRDRTAVQPGPGLPGVLLDYQRSRGERGQRQHPIGCFGAGGLSARIGSHRSSRTEPLSELPAGYSHSQTPRALELELRTASRKREALRRDSPAGARCGPRRLEDVGNGQRAQHLVRLADERMGRDGRLPGVRQAAPDSRLPEYARIRLRTRRRTLRSRLSVVQRLHL